MGKTVPLPRFEPWAQNFELRRQKSGAPRPRSEFRLAETALLPSGSMLRATWRTLASAPLLRRPFTSTRPLLKLAAPPPPPDDKLPTGCMVGVVVSNKMQNSCVVRVERWRVHPKYGKRLRFHRKYMAHDHEDDVMEGDVVRISPCRPLSKRKHYLVQKTLRRQPRLDEDSASLSELSA